MSVSETIGPHCIFTRLPTQRGYWEARAFAEDALQRFAGASDDAGRRRAFYLLAGYYGRTLAILQSALSKCNERLTQTALRNLVTLHRPLAHMHRAAPQAIPAPLALDRLARRALARDLLVRVLSEIPASLDLPAVLQRAGELNIIGAPAEKLALPLMAELVDDGYVAEASRRYFRTEKPYREIDRDALSLQMLVGPELYARLCEAGFRGLHAIGARRAQFRAHFAEHFGFGDDTADLFLESVATLLDVAGQPAPAWEHADLLASPYPLPYQYEAYAVFRGGGYQGQIVEAPTGSGKTLIGMLCIQDWLRALRPGQSILILAPTNNYQQQWVGELCYKSQGLRLSPEMVFAGAPSQWRKYQSRTGFHPPILILTYAALAQIGAQPAGAGFRAALVEHFLGEAGAQYVILDEVHKVAEDLQSASAEVARRLSAGLRAGDLRGLIGFSGSAEAYGARFEELGLHLAHTIPMTDLISYGFVAPFAEYGAPFAHSARERQIRDLLDAYKAGLRDYLEELGAERLRRWFAAIPMAARIELGRAILGMYRDRPDAAEALPRRLTEWETGGPLKLTELGLVTLIQVVRGWPDAELARQAGMTPDRFDEWERRFLDLRSQLAALIYLPRAAARLRVAGFARRLDADALRGESLRPDQAKDLLATAIVGLYESLTDWYHRAGEGRVEALKAVIEAERQARPIGGVIVFDHGRRIRWREGVSAPGYEGAGGLFAQTLGDARFSALTVLSSEIYLSFQEDAPLPPRIARFIEERLMLGEIADAMRSLAEHGLTLPADGLPGWRAQFAERLRAYLPRLADLGAARPGDFSRRVLKPLRRAAARAGWGQAGERLAERLDARNIHLAGLIQTFFAYASLAKSFRDARVAELEQISGTRQRFFVIPMPTGPRKQLMYDLTARLVDDESLGLNLVIVSNWARTGWNVIKPNVLIDATATRDPIAWQQLRGRAMRALPDWNNDCYRLVLRLAGSQPADSDAQESWDEDVRHALAEARAARAADATLDERLTTLLEPLLTPAQRQTVAAGGLSALDEVERKTLVVALMQQRNKVTHIYELVRAFGAGSQIEFDRVAQSWRRREAIAAKHAYDIAVEPFSGKLARGAEHAPLLYAHDPRADLPADLQHRIYDAIADGDARIIAGWLEH